MVVQWVGWSWASHGQTLAARERRSRRRRQRGCPRLRCPRSGSRSWSRKTDCLHLNAHTRRENIGWACAGVVCGVSGSNTHHGVCPDSLRHGARTRKDVSGTGLPSRTRRNAAPVTRFAAEPHADQGAEGRIQTRLGCGWLEIVDPTNHTHPCTGGTTIAANVRSPMLLRKLANQGA